MAKGRIQNRHGTYAQLTSASTPLLPEEIGIVDSGHPDTPSGKAVYYRPASGDPVRLANAEEVLKIYRVNAETVPESENWYDRQGDFYIPETFAGFTDSTPEIVFSDNDVSLWLKAYTQPTLTDGINYFWVKMLTSDDV
jgi:hypothetical protein